ncbi:MAG: hypothetical protein GWP10_21690, partial [Nitrospiraceae bacterium]|nr:hypothetical protein [Nitrospiraceae bacterium]
MATDLEKLELPLNYVPKLELGKEEMTSLSRSLVGDGKMWKINKLTFLLALFCYGCSYSVTPLVKVNRTADQREQTEKIPLSVAVVIPENVVSHTYRAPVGSPRRDVNIATGKAIKSLFKKGIPLIFQDASFIEEIDQAGKFDLYITPYIVTETTSLSKLNNITTEAKSGAIIESSDISFTVEGSGDDYHEISVATQLVDLANNLLLIGTLSASTIITGNDFLNFSFAQSFAVAYEKAFEDLMQKIRQSPEIKKIIVARSLPAELQTKIVFNDKKSLLPNKTIDAGESSAITATL